MMHYQILSEIFLYENSVGNMTRLLGMSKGWANYFQSVAGADSFAVANLFVACSPRKKFSHDAEGNAYEATIQELVDGMFAFAALRGGNPIGRALEFLKHSAELRKVLARPNPDRIALQRALENTDAELSSSGMGEKLLDLPGGYTWKIVTGSEFTRLSGAMASCGIPTDETMVMLFDPNGHPRVMASWNERANTFDQIAGKANSRPDQKYMPMIDALLAHLEATLEHGNASFLAGGHGLRGEI